MGEIISWKQYDEPKPVKYLMGDEIFERESNGSYECLDERVDILGCWGGASIWGSSLSLYFGFKFKDGRIFSTEIGLPATQEEIEKQAEQYLQSLK